MTDFVLQHIMYDFQIVWIFFHIISQTFNNHPITRFLNVIITLSSLLLILKTSNLHVTWVSGARCWSTWEITTRSVNHQHSWQRGLPQLWVTITLLLLRNWTWTTTIYLQYWSIFHLTFRIKKCFTQGPWRVSHSGIRQQKPLTFKRTPPTWSNMVQRPKTELNKIIG